MIELGKNYYLNGNSVMELKKIAKKQSLSIKYIEHIISDLKKHGLVQSERGVSGGYRLARPPEKINLLDIFEATEDISVVNCLHKKETCALYQVCTACEIWEGIQKSITGHLRSRKLVDALKIYETRTRQKVISRREGERT
jgi:Rrf2 family protein